MRGHPQTADALLLDYSGFFEYLLKVFSSVTASELLYVLHEGLGTMKIQVGGLSEGVHEYSFQGEAAALGLGENFPDTVQVVATLERVGNQFHLKASVAASGAFQCDRCAANFRLELRPSYEMHYVADAAEAGRFDPAEVQVLAPGFSVIDIADDVRQTLLLAVPLKLLCRNDCAGLCPHCGRDLNQGPCTCVQKVESTQWEQLRRLQSR